MNSTEDQESIVSETEGEQSISESLRLVPVTESIRYRKRAQSAEKKTEVLAHELVAAKSQISELSEKLNDIEADQRLTRELVRTGVVDLETAVLVAKTRLEAEPEAKIINVIEDLKKEKEYLFVAQRSSSATAKRTATVKDRVTNKQAVLERAARRAATTGSRTDLQEYLRARRNFVCS